LPQLRNDMDEFILCHLLSLVLFVQNYYINGKEVFLLMKLTYINTKFRMWFKYGLKAQKFLAQ
uniref:hypothetical protein n=1 Tax=Segatella hominis TaxID=2518605 RepID=UPI004038CEEB